VTAATQLGKALFWDMQAGSDNKTACATCHFKAGADGRDTNQLNPGANGAWDAQGPNRTVSWADFPFTRSALVDNDNIAGSQGVRKSTFQGFSRAGAELTASVADPVFNVGGVNVRQVTGKNTPSVINAVFNHRNFWNGRAQPDFNGVNPFGSRDKSVRVWTLDPKNNPIQTYINILNASLASQAVGPPLNAVEMSAAGRTFPDLGHKLLLAKPLALQQVSATDSVLGPIADTTTGTGLKVSYKTLIQQAFQPKWWNARASVTVNGKTYTMTEANFSLFWGLSIMLYEATLVSDDSPMDRYLDPAGAVLPRPALTNTTALNALVARLAADGLTVTVNDILTGLALFEVPAGPPPSFPVADPVVLSGPLGANGVLTSGGVGVGCTACHIAAETTSASVRNLSGAGLELGDAALKGAGFDLRMERMFMNLSWTPPGALSPVPKGTDAITFDPSNYTVNVIDKSGTPVQPPLPLPVRTYDAGWYNVGVRPTNDDLGVGATDPTVGPWSWTRFFQTTLLDPTFIKVPGNGLPCTGINLATNFPNELLNATGFPLLSGPLHKTESTDVAGTFKVPALRNVELNGPYFHNGGKSTLAQVVDFYDGAGDFANDTKAPTIVPLGLSATQQKALVAFLLSLTDERVRLQKAPFDHPQLLVPNGDTTPGTDNTIDIPAVGAAGGPAIGRFLGLNPFQQ
jgi:cytochrome c peroxidase